MRKRFLVLLTCFVLLTIPFIGNAEEDYSSYSTEDLINMREQITEELNKRLSIDSLLPPGVYIVGEDIAAGDYIFTGLNTTDGYYVAELYTFDTVEHFISYCSSKGPYSTGPAESGPEGLLIDETIHENETYYLKLKDGMVVCLDKESGTLTDATKASWHK